jgi:hypothetical protein
MYPWTGFALPRAHQQGSGEGPHSVVILKLNLEGGSVQYVWLAQCELHSNGLSLRVPLARLGQVIKL